MTIEQLESKIDLLSLIKRDCRVKGAGVDTYRVSPCPICEGKEDFTIYSKTNSYFSFNGCCNGGSVYKYLMEVKKMNENDAFKELKRLAGEPTEHKKSETNLEKTKALVEEKANDYTDTILNLYNNQTEEDKGYFKKRGMTDELIDRYKLCIGDIKGYGGVRAVIPIWQDGKAIYYNARALTPEQEKKYGRYNKAPGNATFFNIDYLKKATESETIIITEGEFDALSLEAIGIKSIAIGGIKNFERFIEMNKREDILILTAFDNDAAGKKETEKYDYYNIQLPNEINDINDWFLSDENDFRISINKQILTIIVEIQKKRKKKIEEYNKMSAAAYIENFTGQINDSVDTPAISTAFDNLDETLDGGFYEGLYVLGAISSLGKTSFILQVCDQIAMQEKDILYFSLEMSRTELIAKSISRLTFLNATNKHHAKTTRGITAGKKYENYCEIEISLIADSIKKYSSYAKHIYLSEGLGDIGVDQIKEAVKKHVEITGNKPIVVIDYLQILKPSDARATDKQNTDKSVFELKRLSREYKIPVVTISSLNRANYNEDISMAAFKESGAIEYSSDVLLGLQFQNQGEKEFDVNKEKEKEVRKVELKILKNRNGATGKTIKFDYYCLFNYFAETGMKDRKEVNVKR
ncbi:toprim domain-containing protein [Clostridium sp. FP2]|uniref:DnaB-like helicase C-terminal domain-containing protein n=1 Tax=Clostridium sp. FP2 TaxID=2724481 RepID=UPI0013E95771|nr:DnaB-like helicase C-terminal domain-containing protein [Clostridium sp. FP2]MBZ9624391.1 toprim domain-containing protein [Clostridium sp. FP2]